MPDEIIIVFDPRDDSSECDCPACAFEHEAKKLILELLLPTAPENDPGLN